MSFFVGGEQDELLRELKDLVYIEAVTDGRLESGYAVILLQPEWIVVVPELRGRHFTVRIVRIQLGNALI